MLLRSRLPFPEISDPYLETLNMDDKNLQILHPNLSSLSFGHSTPLCRMSSKSIPGISSVQ